MRFPYFFREWKQNCEMENPDWQERGHEPRPKNCSSLLPTSPFPSLSHLPPVPPPCSHHKGGMSMDHTGMVWWPVAASHPTNPLIFMSASLLGDQLLTLLSRGLKEAKTWAGPEGEGINQIPFGNQARNVIQAGAKGLLGFFVVWVFFPYFFHMQ